MLARKRKYSSGAYQPYHGKTTRKGRTNLKTPNRDGPSVSSGAPDPDAALSAYLRAHMDPWNSPAAPIPYLPSSRPSIQVMKQTARIELVTGTAGMAFFAARPLFGNDLPMAIYSTSAYGGTSIATYNPGVANTAYLNWQGCPYASNQFRQDAPNLGENPIMRARCVAMALRAYNITAAANRGGAIYALNGGDNSILGQTVATLETLRANGGVRDGDADGGFTEVAWSCSPEDLDWSKSLLPNSWLGYIGTTGSYTIREDNRIGFIIEAPSGAPQTYIVEAVGIFEYTGFKLVGGTPANPTLATHPSPPHVPAALNVPHVVSSTHAAHTGPTLTHPAMKSSIGSAFRGAVGWLGRQVKTVGRAIGHGVSAIARQGWDDIKTLAPYVARDAVLAAF